MRLLLTAFKFLDRFRSFSRAFISFIQMELDIVIHDHDSSLEKIFLYQCILRSWKINGISLSIWVSLPLDAFPFAESRRSECTLNCLLESWAIRFPENEVLVAGSMGQRFSPLHDKTKRKMHNMFHWNKLNGAFTQLYERFQDSTRRLKPQLIRPSYFIHQQYRSFDIVLSHQIQPISLSVDCSFFEFPLRRHEPVGVGLFVYISVTRLKPNVCV